MPNPHNPEEKCQNCRFFEPPAEELEEHKELDGKYGFCLRFPPQMAVKPLDGSLLLRQMFGVGIKAEPKHVALLPFVKPEDWCGEYKAISAPT